MAIDLSQFHQVFFQETEEHLASMESLLLDLNVAEPDVEQLNAIFRAAHSVKGSAGTFGFTDLAEVTHILENLLDRIRKGELALREEMIDAFLDAGDMLKHMLAAHRGEGEVDPAAIGETCARLESLSGNPVAADGPGREEEGSPGRPRGVDLRFVVEGGQDEAARAVDGLLAELGGLGGVRIVSVPDAVGQPYRLELSGDVDAGAVREIVEFVARSDSIRISPLGEAGNGDAEPAFGLFDEEDSTTAADPAYGFFDASETQPSQDAEAFGFFEPVESPPAPAAAADEGYGFFDGPPAPAAEPAPARRSEKPASKPVPVRPAASKGGGDATIRVGIEKVDQLINLVGELVITQAMLLQSASGLDPVQFERLHNGLSQLERNSRDLQEAVMSIRMMPMSVVFSRFPRVVRELSQKLGKKVELKLVGEGTELDKSLIERITDPLTHLVRNSLDHGIEPPEVRSARGKPPTGTITLRAYHQGGNIVIEVGDDGAGLSRERILAKAAERGLPVHEQMSDQEVWQLIFEAGFSTAEQVTEVSGRGVGMDVVKRNIQAMGGRVEIDSVTGVGTRMTVRLPLTLAILDGMSVAVGKEVYILPLGYVVESLQAAPGTIKSISGVSRLLFVRGEYLPVVPLHEVFAVPGAVTGMERGIMVIVEVDGARVALFVDALVGQQQVVIKSLEANYRKVQGVSGATIMGDGHVALILDVAALAGMAKDTLPAAA